MTGAPRSDALLGPSLTATLTRFRPPARDSEAALPCLARDLRGSRRRRDSPAREPQGARRPSGGRPAGGSDAPAWRGLADLHRPAARQPSWRGRRQAAGLHRGLERDRAGRQRRQGRDRRHDDLDARAGFRQARAALRPRMPAIPRRAPRSSCSASTSTACLVRTAAHWPKWRAPTASAAPSISTRLALATAHPGELSRDWLAGHESRAPRRRPRSLRDCRAERGQPQAGMDWVEAAPRRADDRLCGAARALEPGARPAPWRRSATSIPPTSALDFNSLPFFTAAGVLQIPVHPFSPERFAVHQEDAGLGPPGSRRCCITS